MAVLHLLVIQDTAASQVAPSSLPSHFHGRDLPPESLPYLPRPVLVVPTARMLPLAAHYLTLGAVVEAPPHWRALPSPAFAACEGSRSLLRRAAPVPVVSALCGTRSAAPVSSASVLLVARPDRSLALPPAALPHALPALVLPVHVLAAVQRVLGPTAANRRDASGAPRWWRVLLEILLWCSSLPHRDAAAADAARRALLAAPLAVDPVPDAPPGPSGPGTPSIPRTVTLGVVHPVRRPARTVDPRAHAPIGPQLDALGLDGGAGDG